MQTLKKLLEDEIVGSRGSWSYQFEIGIYDMIGGLFVRKSEAYADLRYKIDGIFSEPSVAQEFFDMRARLKGSPS